MKYRSEIDGLRCIAVMVVVLYHASFSFYEKAMFPGGFAGVDIFFVISGYLITFILLTEMADENFSFLSFYERRARRILPALFFVMLASMPFAWVYMLPKSFQEYAGSLISSTGFLSNFYFLSLQEYAAEESLYKPFIHTWSLSVEEQFYLVLPVFLLISWKLAKKTYKSPTPFRNIYFILSGRTA